MEAVERVGAKNRCNWLSRVARELRAAVEGQEYCHDRMVISPGGCERRECT
jgi:hypothetical protein